MPRGGQLEQDLGWQSHGFAEMPWLGRRVQRLGLDVAPGLQPKHLHSHPRPRDCRCWMRPLPGDIRGFRLENLGRGLSPTQRAPWRPLLPLGHDRCQIHAWSVLWSIPPSHAPMPNLAAPPAPGSEPITAPQTPPRGAHAAQRSPRITTGTLWPSPLIPWPRPWCCSRR